MEESLIRTILDEQINPDAQSFLGIIMFKTEEQYETSSLEFTIHGKMENEEADAIGNVVKDLLGHKEQSGVKVEETKFAIVTGSDFLKEAEFVNQAIAVVLEPRVKEIVFKLVTDRATWKNLTTDTIGFI